LRRLFKLALPFAAALAATAVLAPPASAGNGLGPLPPGGDSDYIIQGGAAPSDGITPQVGEMLAGFLKGSESYLGNTTTTVVDFSLPQGVTIVNDLVASAASGGRSVSLLPP
jgi:hypothetical protein